MILDNPSLHPHHPIAASRLSSHRSLREIVYRPLAGVGIEHHEQVADHHENQGDETCLVKTDYHLGHDVDDTG